MALDTAKPKKTIRWGLNFPLYYEEMTLPKYMAEHFIEARRDRKRHNKLLEKAKQIRQAIKWQRKTTKIEVRQLGLNKFVYVAKNR